MSASHAQLPRTPSSKRLHSRPTTNSVWWLYCAMTLASGGRAPDTSHRHTDMSYDDEASKPCACGLKRTRRTAYVWPGRTCVGAFGKRMSHRATVLSTEPVANTFGSYLLQSHESTSQAPHAIVMTEQQPAEGSHSLAVRSPDAESSRLGWCGAKRHSYATCVCSASVRIDAGRSGRHTRTEPSHDADAKQSLSCRLKSTELTSAWCSQKAITGRPPVAADRS
mmetsp:Transcript_83298/g.249601  ORF Transcript_83298/g.249601 Transcript_83298/m.249601 type:complete len:223 (+) Transcript_83298:194-862(+)